MADKQNRKCVHFIRGNCALGSNCKFSHQGDIGNVANFSSTPMETEYIKSDSLTLVNVVQIAPVKSLKRKQCFDFVKGNCARGSTCKFDHGILKQTATEADKTVTTDGEKAPAKRKRSRNKSKLAVPDLPATGSGSDVMDISNMQVDNNKNNDTPSKSNEKICGAFLSGSCRYGSKCKFQHASAIPPEINNHEMTLDDETVKTSSANESLNNFMTSQTFASIPMSPKSLQAIKEVMKYEFLTQVQAASIPIIISGNDCLAKAKTGTGKTLAFLIPAIERFLSAPQTRRASIPILVISPTRELASQISQEAIALLTHHIGIRVVTVFGGTNINTDKRHLSHHDATNPAILLVATPGRLMDHLKNTENFSDLCALTTTLILDEADQLLEMGFRNEIEKIIAYLPPKNNRQTIMFSATVSPEIQDVARKNLRSDHAFVDTVGVETEQTHEHVRQEIAVVSQQVIIPAILQIITHHMQQTPRYKIIVFFTTARVTGFMAEVFHSMGFNILEMHSRLSQSKRTKTSDQFRDGTSMIMFSSDVSARGMDYPNVTFVIQVGITDQAQYIHRLGRTARAGKEGSGLVLLADFEEKYMRKELRAMNLEECQIALSPEHLTSTLKSKIALALAEVNSNIERKKSAEQAYQAWLGFYNSNLRSLGWTKEKLVEMANYFSLTIGLTQVPFLEKKTVGKMGLKDVVGLRIRG